MDRRGFVVALAGGLLLPTGCTARTTPAGRTLAHPVPVNTPARIGAWTVTVTGWTLYGAPPVAYGVTLTARYRGEEPTTFLATFDPRLIGHDRTLRRADDVDANLMTSVVRGATVTGDLTFTPAAADLRQPDAAILALGVGADQTARLLHPTYTYFALDTRT